MASIGIATRGGRVLAAAAFAVTLAVTAAPTPSRADVSPGAAVGIGLGSFALGTALGASARPYGPGYYPYGGYYAPPAPAYYYPPAPAYYPRNCWDPYYHRYYAC